MTALVVLTVVAFVLCLALTPLLRDLAERRGIVDRPDQDRKLHLKAVPRIGGVPIMLSYACALALMLFVAPHSVQVSVQHRRLLVELLPATGVVFLTGLLDDLVTLKPWQKLAGQVLAAILAVASGATLGVAQGHWHALWLTAPLSIFWLVGCTNAFNLIDGMDGLATGIGLSATSTIVVVALCQGNGGLAIATAPLAGCLLAFLRYNFNPASVFLGDSGSLTIGFMLGCFSLIWGQHEGSLLGMAAPVMAMALPLIDVALAILRRLLRRMPIFKGDRSHIHHMLLKLGFKTRTAALILYGVCGVGAGLAILQSLTAARYHGPLLLVFFALIGTGVRCLGYVEFSAARRTLQGDRLVRHMRNEIYVQDLTSSLSKARSVDECWNVIHETCRDLSFASVQMRMNQQLYEAEFLASMGPKTPWKLTVGLGRDGLLTLTRPHDSASPELLVSVLSQFQQAISAHEQLFEAEARRIS